ncbi:MAG: PRD domain-containing protein, partial [Bacillota bacterium]
SSGDVGPGMSPGGAGESTLARGEGGVRPPVDLPADLPSHVPANLSPDLPAALPPDLPDPGPVSRQHDPYRLPAEFYDYLEERVQALRRQGLADREITQRLRGEIEAYFRRFLRTPVQGGGLAREELARVVGEEVVAAAEEMLRYAARRLNREYDPRVLYGLALHIQGTLERIRNGRGVHGHDLAQLHGEYPAEFAVAAGMVTILERRLGVRLPVDETGLLTLFLRSAHSPPEPGEGGVGVLVICHGSATASSMVEFAHALLGVRVARALDVPLEMPPAVVRREAARLVRELDQGKGVLLLVDMGSLVTMVGDLQAETGVAIRAVDRVSTPLVLEAVRKASLPGVTLEEVAAAVADPPAWRAAPRPAVLTVCLTGEGSARQLQRLVEQGVPELAGAGVAVVSLEMVPGRPLGVPAGLVPLAVVGTFDPQLPGVPFIPAVEVLRGPGLLRLRWLLTAAGLLPAGGSTEPAAAPPAPPAFYPPGADGAELPLPPDAIQRVMEALGEELRFVNPRLLVPDILRAMGRLARSLGRSWGEHLLVWVVMHLGAVMDRLVRGEAVPPNPEAELWAERFPEVHAAVREALTELEERYRVRFPPAEVARLTEVAVMETS